MTLSFHVASHASQLNLISLPLPWDLLWASLRFAKILNMLVFLRFSKKWPLGAIREQITVPFSPDEVLVAKTGLLLIELTSCCLDLLWWISVLPAVTQSYVKSYAFQEINRTNALGLTANLKPPKKWTLGTISGLIQVRLSEGQSR